MYAKERKSFKYFMYKNVKWSFIHNINNKTLGIIQISNMINKF